MSLCAELIVTLDRALAEAVNPFTFMVTDAPADRGDLATFIDAALASADRHHIPLLEVRLGARKAAAIGTVAGVPVRAHGEEDVVRLAFGRRAGAIAPFSAGL